eukprot:6176733-Pleurochrysis_carterae.AAC.2
MFRAYARAAQMSARFKSACDAEARAAYSKVRVMQRRAHAEACEAADELLLHTKFKFKMAKSSA